MLSTAGSNTEIRCVGHLLAAREQRIYEEAGPGRAKAVKRTGDIKCEIVAEL